MPGPFTSSIRLSWNANSEPDVAGYRLYAGQASGVYNSALTTDVGNVTTGSITINANGSWFFAVACYDTSNNESNKSTEVSRSYFLCGNF